MRHLTCLLPLLILTACGTLKPIKGGVSTGISTFPSGTNSFTIAQPENPEQASTHTFKRVETREFYPGAHFPAISVPVRETITQEQGVTLGAAQKDTSRTLTARLSAMRPVQYAGILLIVAAGVLFYFGWPTPAALSAVCGVGMIILAAVVPGNETPILIGGVLVALVGCAAVFYAWHRRGDSFDSNPDKNQIPPA